MWGMKSILLLFLILISSLSAAQEARIVVSNPNLTFVRTDKSKKGIDHYTDETGYHYFIAVIDPTQAAILPVTADLVEVSGTTRERECTLPTSWIGLDNFCKLPTKHLPDLKNYFDVTPQYFGLVSGTYGASVHEYSVDDSLPFLYQKDGSVLFRGYEMVSPPARKKALVLKSDSADVVTVPSTADENEIKNFLKDHPAIHIITGHHIDDGKNPLNRIGRNLWGVRPDGKVVILIAPYSGGGGLNGGLTQVEGKNVLRAFGIDDEKMVTFDGSGSAQAMIGDDFVTAGTRYLTNGFALFAGVGPYFFDVDKGEWYFDYVNRLAQAGVITGYADGSYRPNQAVTRAEFVKLMVTASGSACSQATPCPNSETYGDVNDGDWFAPFIKAAFNRGWLDTTQTSFRPNESINRAEVAKLLVTALHKQNDAVGNSIFADVTDAQIWYFPYIVIAKQLGIFDGYPLGKNCSGANVPGQTYFCPDQSLNRAEAAKVIVESFY